MFQACNPYTRAIVTCRTEIQMQRYDQFDWINIIFYWRIDAIMAPGYNGGLTHCPNITGTQHRRHSAINRTCQLIIVNEMIERPIWLD